MKKPNKDDYWGEVINKGNGIKEQLFLHEDYQNDLENYIEYLQDKCNLGVVGKRTFLNDDELKEARQKIWNYLNEQHDVILLDSDVDEILIYAKAIE